MQASPMEGESKQQEAGGGEKKMKVVVAIDESEGSLYTLTWVLDYLFAPSTGVASAALAKLMLVHVVQPLQQFIYPAGPGMVYASAGMADSMKEVQQQNAEALIARASQICREKGLEPQALLLEGDPKEMICQAIEQLHADLAVVGNRGLGKIKRAFLGSVSDYCAHHAKCPLVIVKPPK